LTIGSNDLWVAATALVHGATLATANPGEFSRIPGLILEDWSLE
jgi:tRNA(fMet)-specific endonuclease VapC